MHQLSVSRHTNPEIPVVYHFSVEHSLQKSSLEPINAEKYPYGLYVEQTIHCVISPFGNSPANRTHSNAPGHTSAPTFFLGIVDEIIALNPSPMIGCIASDFH